MRAKAKNPLLGSVPVSQHLLPHPPSTTGAPKAAPAGVGVELEAPPDPSAAGAAPSALDELLAEHAARAAGAPSHLEQG